MKSTFSRALDIPVIAIGVAEEFLEDLREEFSRQDRVVSACESFSEARYAVCEGCLVIAAVNGVEKEAKDFVTWLRASNPTSRFVAVVAKDFKGLRERLGADEILVSDSINAMAESEFASQEATSEADIDKEFSTVEWMDGLGPAIAILDKNLCYVYANQSWSRRFETYNVKGKQHRALFADSDTRWDQVYAAGLLGERSEGRQIGITHPDQETFWEVNPWRDEKGDVAGLSVVLIEQKMSLAENNLLLGSKIDQSELPVSPHCEAPAVIIDLAGKVRLLTRGGRSICARPDLTEAAPYEDVFPALRDEKTSAVRERLVETAENGWSFPASDVEQHVDAAGKARRMFWSNNKFTNAKGEIVGLLRFGSELSRDDANPQMLAGESELGEELPEPDAGVFRDLCDTSPEAVLVLDTTGKVVFANHKCRLLLGCNIVKPNGLNEALDRGQSGASDEAGLPSELFWGEVWRLEEKRSFNLVHDEENLRLEFDPRTLDNGLFVCSIRDVGKKEDYSRHVEDQAMRFQALFRDTDTPLALLHEDLTIADANPAFCMFLQMPRNTVNGVLLTELISPDHVAGVHAYLESLSSPRPRFEHPKVAFLQNGRVLGQGRLRFSHIQEKGRHGIRFACFVEKSDPAGEMQRLLPVIHKRLKRNLEIVQTLARLSGPEHEKKLVGIRSRLAAFYHLHKGLELDGTDEVVRFYQVCETQNAFLNELFGGDTEIRIPENDLALPTDIANPLALIYNELLISILPAKPRILTMENTVSPNGLLERLEISWSELKINPNSANLELAEHLAKEINASFSNTDQSFAICFAPNSAKNR